MSPKCLLLSIGGSTIKIRLKLHARVEGPGSAHVTVASLVLSVSSEIYPWRTRVHGFYELELVGDLPVANSSSWIL